jgi:hypothetical protein
MVNGLSVLDGQKARDGQGHRALPALEEMATVMAQDLFSDFLLYSIFGIEIMSIDNHRNNPAGVERNLPSQVRIA